VTPTTYLTNKITFGVLTALLFSPITSSKAAFFHFGELDIDGRVILK
jgi:hypothetical protein